MAHATWAQQPLRGSPWVLTPAYCHQMITETQPWGQHKRFGERRILEYFHFVTKHPTNCNFRALGGFMAEATWA